METLVESIRALSEKIDHDLSNNIASKIIRLSELVTAEKALPRDKYPCPSLIREIQEHINEMEEPLALLSSVGKHENEYLRLMELKKEYF